MSRLLMTNYYVKTKKESLIYFQSKKLEKHKFEFVGKLTNKFINKFIFCRGNLNKFALFHRKGVYSLK